MATPKESTIFKVETNTCIMFIIKKNLLGKPGKWMFILVVAMSLAVWSCGNETGGDEDAGDQTEMQTDDSEHPSGGEHPSGDAEHPTQDTTAADTTGGSEHPNN